jgi:hypothetical protein
VMEAMRGEEVVRRGAFLVGGGMSEWRSAGARAYLGPAASAASRCDVLDPGRGRRVGV